MLVLSAGSPGSAVGLCLDGVDNGVGAASATGAGEGDESGVCGKACKPAAGVAIGDEAAFGAGEESGSSGGACTAASWVETGDVVGAWARSGHVRAVARHPPTMKRFFTETDFWIGILV